MSYGNLYTSSSHVFRTLVCTVLIHGYTVAHWNLKNPFHLFVICPHQLLCGAASSSLIKSVKCVGLLAGFIREPLNGYVWLYRFPSKEYNAFACSNSIFSSIALIGAACAVFVVSGEEEAGRNRRSSRFFITSWNWHSGRRLSLGHRENARTQCLYATDLDIFTLLELVISQ